MRWACALMTIAILPSLGAAQASLPGNPQAQVKPEDMCTVEGVVVNGVTGDPIKNISVTLQLLSEHGQAPNDLTDVTGRFAFQNVAPGRYMIRASPVGPNRVFSRSGPGGSHRVLTLDPGQHVRDIIFRLQPGGVITGTVYDEDSQPVMGAQVEAFPAGHGNHSGIVATAQTNDLGGYRLFGIPAGKYYVVAMGARPFPSRARTDEVYLPTLYPGTSDAGQALPVEVRAGDEQGGIDLSLILVRGASVRGRVIMPAVAKSVGGAYVQLLPREAAPDLPQQLTQYGAASEDGKGNFEIHGVPPGAYNLSANWGNEKGFYHGQVPVDVGNDNVDGITVTLLPGFNLQGRVYADAGMPLDFAQLNIYLEPTGTAGVGAGGAKIKPDGTFEFENVFEGEYRLHVSGFPEEFYVKAAKWGASDALSSGLNVGRDSGGTLVINLALDGGRVDGVVIQDKQTVPGAFVTLVPDPPNRSREDLYSQTAANRLGRFSLLGLPPGDFKVFAWEPGNSVDFRDPEFIKNFENRGAHVHIDPKQQQSVQLDLIPAEDEPQ
jgi:hypothetical protein